jgi:2-iminobutanoate/2-iminopropanoate deaminase
MKTEKIVAEGGMPPLGPYSPGIAFDKLVFVSGQTPADPKTGNVPDGIEAQTRQALENVWAVLDAAGVKRNAVASVTVYLTDLGDFAAMNKVYAEYFEDPYPSRVCVQISKLPKDGKIMVSAIGVRD